MIGNIFDLIVDFLYVLFEKKQSEEQDENTQNKEPDNKGE